MRFNGFVLLRNVKSVFDLSINGRFVAQYLEDLIKRRNFKDGAARIHIAVPMLLHDSIEHIGFKKQETIVLLNVKQGITVKDICLMYELFHFPR